MAEQDQAAPAAPEHPGRRFTFPSAFTVLFGITVLVWLLAFIVPTGSYKVSDKTGGPVPGSYHHVDSGLSFTDRLMELFLSPVNGLYGVKSAASGFIGPYESGELFGAAGRVLLRARDRHLHHDVDEHRGDRQRHRPGRAPYSNRGAALIVMLMVLFSIGGTTEGMAEETLGFYALVVPLMLSLGYDRMVAAGTILIGAGVGVLASTVNPFATGVASDAAGISIGDGIGYRFLMYVVLVPVGVWFVLRYARKVKTDPARSLTGPQAGDEEAAARGVGEPPVLTGRQKAVLAVVAFTFAFMIFTIVPWAQVINGPDADSYTWQFDWYFPELAALFLLMSLVVGLIGGMGEKEPHRHPGAGCGRLHRGRPDHRAGPRDHGDHEQRADHRHGAALDGERGQRHLGRGVRGADVPAQPAAGVPGAVDLGPRRAGDADPGAARRLRRGVPRDGGHGVPVRLRASSTWSRRRRRWSWVAWRSPRSATTSTSGSSGRCW